MVEGMQVCKQVYKQVGMAAGKQVHMAVEGIQVRMLIADNMAIQVHKQVRMTAHWLHTAGHNIQVGHSSIYCQSIQPIEVQSCREEATRRLFLVVFSL